MKPTNRPTALRRIQQLQPRRPESLTSHTTRAAIRPAGVRDRANASVARMPVLAPSTRSQHAELFGKKPDDRKPFIAATAPFRDALAEANRLAAELAKLPPGDPRAETLRAQLKAADAKLFAESGYTRETVPAAGTAWLDPQYNAEDLHDGKLHASKFPPNAPVLTPPSPMQAMFERGRPFEFLGNDGEVVTVRDAEAYRALVAANRAETGMPVSGGEPVGVHVGFEGGGGKGKRYGPALSELYAQGVTPVSVSGNSVGAIAAGLIAAGMDPVEVDRMIKDPEIAKFKDWDLEDGGGAFNGNFAYEYFDRKLRELTGITDRPVTFADLKLPCQLIATTMSDTRPPAGKDDLSKVENRIFVFSQETTPNTPVALGILASVAMPGVWDPVQMVDPVTGREVHVVDGGVLDSLPMGYNRNDLPEIGLSLLEMGSNHPEADKNEQGPKPLPKGSVDVTSIFGNAVRGYTMHEDGGAARNDFLDRTQPKPGQFMLNVPTWDLTDPRRQNTTLGYAFDAKVDPLLDVQSRNVTRNFLREYLDDLGDPTASGSNVTSKVPDRVAFEVEVTFEGKRYTARYAGGDRLRFEALDPGAKDLELKLGEEKIEAIYLDHLSFGDLAPRLAYELHQDQRPFWEKALDWFEL